MDKFSRAVRRHHVERLKQTRKGYWGYDRPRTVGPAEMCAKALGKVVQYPASCSCTMCGNSRKWFGQRTTQELRWMQQVE